MGYVLFEVRRVARGLAEVHAYLTWRLPDSVQHYLEAYHASNMAPNVDYCMGMHPAQFLSPGHLSAYNISYSKISTIILLTLIFVGYCGDSTRHSSEYGRIPGRSFLSGGD